MNAAEARALTKQQISGSIILPVKTVELRIAKAIAEGKFEIVDPDHVQSDKGFVSVMPCEQRLAIKRHFESLGYVWTEHANPDPGHPCSNAYSTLSW